MFNIYSFNESNIKNFLDKIEDKNDNFSKKFASASLFSRFQKEKDLCDKGIKLFTKIDWKEQLNLYKTIENKIIQMEDQSTNINIQLVINEILGLGIPLDNEENKKMREDYFQLMINTKLIETEFKTLDDFFYDPGLVVKKIWDSKKIDQVILGCGKTAEFCPGSCYYRNENTNHENSLKIDIQPDSLPDVVADMHDPRLWKAIPKISLNRVLDHTNGKFLFEDKETLESIYYRLKPEGTLVFEVELDNENAELLKGAGFIISEDQKTAIRPNISL